ncbi:rhombosortase [Teredinibacter sp. KSP-S5-2]|uniref:rhombosortase n=1 Tax=Teredinibacter sp. KSP-S5-2 TaxID=3034506 RepID=UPI002935287C|nr:rhombosortase [Teredinibacter sp. KSP-S5-2]WNO08897.1 rhombosortase [Teredinibacter sp. KSP-S5-2]
MNTINSLLNLHHKTSYLFGRELVAFLKVTTVITFLVALCQLNFEGFVFDRTAITDGEYWRLVTCHFTHSSFSHGFWDVLALAGSIVWLARYSPRMIIPAVVSGIVAVSFLLLSKVSPLEYYCGLSGILFSPLIVAAYIHLKHHKGFTGIAPFIVISTKLMVDLISQNTMFVHSDWYAYPESHLAGAMAGAIIIYSDKCIEVLKNRTQRKNYFAILARQKGGR